MNLPNEVLTLKGRAPKAEKPKPSPIAPKAKTPPKDWLTLNNEIIYSPVGKTANTYIDRAIDGLTKVWDNDFPLDGATEEAREKQAAKQMARKRQLGEIALVCEKAQTRSGSPQKQAIEIVDYFTDKNQPDVALLFIESLVKRVAVSAYYEYRSYQNGTAVNPEIAIANLKRMRECHALNGLVMEGQDGEAEFAASFGAVHDNGEEVAPSEDHNRDAASTNDQIPIAATNAEDAELAALAVQQWGSAYWRCMTTNEKQQDVLPLAIGPPPEYTKYTTFLTFFSYRTEKNLTDKQTRNAQGLEALKKLRDEAIANGLSLD